MFYRQNAVIYLYLCDIDIQVFNRKVICLYVEKNTVVGNSIHSTMGFIIKYFILEILGASSFIQFNSMKLDAPISLREIILPDYMQH